MDSLHCTFFLGISVSFLELNINALFKLVVIADKLTNFVPDFHIFLFDKLFGSLIFIFEVPFKLIEDNSLKFLPFQFSTFPNHHVAIIQLMASKGYSIIIGFMYITSKPLNLMACFATMNTILEALNIVDLVTLPSAKRTHLVTPKCLRLHFLIEVSYEVLFLKRILNWLFRVKMGF